MSLTGATIESFCAVCPHYTEGEPDQYVGFVFEMLRLAQVGYPFRRDQIPLATWHDMWLLGDYLEARRLGLGSR